MTSTVLSVLAQPHWALLTFAVFWFSGAAVIARLAGWAALASEFPAQGAPEGSRLRFVSGSLGSRSWPMRYRNCLRLILGKEGLHISVAFPFNFRSKALLIPWTSIALTEEKQGLSTRTFVFRFGQQWSHLVLSGVTGQQLKAALQAASRDNAP